MKRVLLIDFGSTYTKVTAVDMEKERLLGTAASYTTVENDQLRAGTGADSRSGQNSFPGRRRKGHEGLFLSVDGGRRSGN